MQNSAADTSTELSVEEIESIKQIAVRQHVAKDTCIFSEGDHADSIYFIESGLVSIFIQKFTRQEEISTLEPGDYFGEMAFFSRGKRSASAMTLSDTVLLTVDRDAFSRLLESDASISEKVNTILENRNEELAHKENLFDSICSSGSSFHIGIKGDPSLRESAFSRERYVSVVDQILPLLQGALYDLLVSRCVCELTIHFNSGEIHTKSVCNPFTDEIHPANKLLNKAYIERHFPPMSYEEKTGLIRRNYGFITSDPLMSLLPESHREIIQACYQDWHPVKLHQVAETISRLLLLRKVPNFYIRNFTFSIIKDAIRMQFNCDGTHILDAAGYQEFLRNNLIEDEPYTASNPERRNTLRRHAGDASDHAGTDRRSPPGRRLDDWERLSGDLKKSETPQ